MQDNRDYWNKRAETFGSSCGNVAGDYARRFVELLGASEGDTVFDMGCATGTLAVPLARAGHAVTACDFAPRMIEKLDEVVEAENLPITTKVMAWEDRWEDFGIGPKSFDIALASRCLPIKDNELVKPLERLDQLARGKVAISVSASMAPRCDGRLLEYLGRPLPRAREHADIIAALVDMGRFPTLAYIPRPRPMRFSTRDEARDELRRMAGRDEFDSREAALFDRYFDEHFVRVEGEAGVMYELDYPIIICWAFICWRTDGQAM